MAAKETNLYVRNKRPNRVIVKFAGLRHVLERRGNRADTISLPVEAHEDTTIKRWLQDDILEKISREAFTKLAARQVDAEPRFFLKRRGTTKIDGVPLTHADGDAIKSLTQISNDYKKIAGPKPEWAGELMTTEEEIETLGFEEEQQKYPSKHRADADERRAMGY